MIFKPTAGDSLHNHWSLIASSDLIKKNAAMNIQQKDNELSDNTFFKHNTESIQEHLPNVQNPREHMKIGTDVKENQMILLQNDNISVNLFNLVPFGMAIVLPNGRISHTNEALHQLLGYSGGEFAAKNLGELIWTEEANSLEAFSPETFIADEKSGVEKRLVNKDGNSIYALIKTVVIRDHNGTLIKLLLQFVDITERKEYEDLLQKRNEELEKANKELDRFVYSTSHDLRAPLRSILGLIYIMQNETDPSALKTYLDMMRSSVNRMDAFIKEIVDLSRNSQQDVKHEKLDLKTVINETFESLRYIPGAEKIDLSMEINQETDFCSDESRLKVILNNLIANAITYHNFSQEQPFIKVQAVIKNKYTLIEVIDNGKGIKKEHQEKIFDMFYRASEDTKGSGLGLYIVKEAIAKLKGSIKLKSKLGAGTKFSIKIFNKCE